MSCRRSGTWGRHWGGPYVIPVEESFRWHPIVARSQSIAAFIPALERLIAEAMDEWKVPGLAVAVVQNGEVAPVSAYGLRDVEAFELPEAPGRLLPDRLAISFSTDREGNIASLAAPFEPLVKDIVFTRTPAGDCMNPGFRQHCTGTFSLGATTVVVRQDNTGQLTLTVGSEPPCKLRPYQSRTFIIDELEGFRVELHPSPDGEVDKLFFHQRNGTFVARRA
jgi:hypothetical protein